MQSWVGLQPRASTHWTNTLPTEPHLQLPDYFTSEGFEMIYYKMGYTNAKKNFGGG